MDRGKRVVRVEVDLPEEFKQGFNRTMWVLLPIIIAVPILLILAWFILDLIIASR